MSLDTTVELQKCKTVHLKKDQETRKVGPHGMSDYKRVLWFDDFHYLLQSSFSTELKLHCAIYYTMATYVRC